MTDPILRRSFANLPNRQVHFRYAGIGEIPLVMLHASPGSSKQLERLIMALGKNHKIIAPDTPGNGDSTPLALDAPSIAHYAVSTVELLDTMGLQQVDIYGSHTGASIAIEIAVIAPGRIRKIILDGIGLFSTEERDDYMAHYAPKITPDLRGSHLNWAYMFCRDQYLFWPWFKQTAEHSRASGLPSAQNLHNWVLEVLKSIETYHLAYRASFQYPKKDRLPLVTQPILLLAAENDPLLNNTKLGAGLAQKARLQITPPSSKPDAVNIVADFIQRFLHEPLPL